MFVGNLGKFTDTLSKYGEKFRADHTYTLIIRLRHNVIKTGIRMINMSYSKISLSDIAQKLQLDSPEDAEYIVAKAIRDNVIDATINHEQGIDTILNAECEERLDTLSVELNVSVPESSLSIPLSLSPTSMLQEIIFFILNF